MATLYEMTEISKRLFNLFDNDEIDEQTVSDTLEGIGVEGKLEDYCKVIRQLEADAEMFKSEKQRVADRQSRSEKNAGRMKDAVLNFLQSKGSSKEKAGLFEITTRSSEAVIIDDVNKVDKSFLRYSDPTADKTAIKKALKSGCSVDGAHIEQRNSLQIK